MKFEKLSYMNLPSRIAGAKNPVLFKLSFCIFPKTGNRYYLIEKGKISDNCLVRIDSKCVYAHIFGSARCDCAEQLHEAIKKIGREGGLLIYCYDQDGRGISLKDHFIVYKLQDMGYDTVEANLKAGLKPDQRKYDEVIEILKSYGLRKIRLLTNNPERIYALGKAGIDVIRIPFKVAKLDRYNSAQLVVKQTKLGHMFGFNLNDKKLKSLFVKSIKQKW